MHLKIRKIWNKENGRFCTKNLEKALKINRKQRNRSRINIGIDGIENKETVVKWMWHYSLEIQWVHFHTILPIFKRYKLLLPKMKMSYNFLTYVYQRNSRVLRDINADNLVKCMMWKNFKTQDINIYDTYTWANIMEKDAGRL